MRVRTCYVEAIAVLLQIFGQTKASTITPAPKATSTGSAVSEVPQTQTCEFRTINYITDSLPQQCLRSSWSSGNGSAVTSTVAGNATVTNDGLATESGLVISISETGQDVVQSGDPMPGAPVININISIAPLATPAESVSTDIEGGELNEASFLSFEEWKKQTLDKAGQDKNANIGNKKSGEKKRDADREFQNHLDSLGDEGEIDLDFGNFQGDGSGKEETQKSETESVTEQEKQDGEGTGEKKRKDQYRSKDAGKTCKERFSYASFDAGATILKTHSGAKNAKAVLIENKDSYMLSECAAENKFIIIELSEDIWIDTLVLANYEFFSSMIRTFRVSVSDRYPVKMEKWKDLGTYEARNSREIQAFLIENPQIWARYIRIEFLSHFGSEYYCPLSLVRVHGTRMLESWKETEANGEDDEADEAEGETEEEFVHDAVADVVKEEERVQAELARLTQLASNSTRNDKSDQKDENDTEDRMTTPWKTSGFYLFNMDYQSEGEIVCLPSDAPPLSLIETEASPTASITTMSESNPVASPTATPVSTDITTSSPAATPPSERPIGTNSSISETPPTATSVSDTTSLSPSDSATSSTSIISSAIAKPQNTTSILKNKTTSTISSPPSLPTIQESFFKAVSRRLQLLETNSSLSLAYIEEQSKILREAFNKVSAKQILKTTSFIDTVNATFFADLREIRQQYDQIWQSTVISLESQREESRREILAISSRLNILADEAVFQKRMSIVQSVLLILCLGLVIFSRVSSGGNLEFPNMHSRSRGVSVYPLDSPGSPDTPNFRRSDSLRSGRWLEVEHRRRRTESPSPSPSPAPPTPISLNSPSRSDSNTNPLARTPPSGADDLLNNIQNHQNQDPLPAPLEIHTREPPSLSKSSPKSPNSAMRTPKKRKAFIRQHQNNYQQSSPPASISASAEVPFEAISSIPGGNPLPGNQDGSLHASINLDSRLPSPPLDSGPEEEENEGWKEVSPKGRRRFSIARKPLPALPSD